MKTLSERLKYARKKAKLSQKTLAKDAGISQSAIALLESGARSGSASIGNIASALGVDVRWLTDGIGTGEPRPMSAKGHSNVAYIRQIYTYDSVDELPDDTVLIPQIDLKLSAGHGRDNPVIDEKTPIPFMGDWIKQRRIKPKDVVMMKVDGDSMEPKLSNGHSVLIDKSDTRIPMNGAVFAIIVNGEWMVKRCSQRIGGGIIIKSDNQNGDFFNAELDEEEAQKAGVEIVGRVRYSSGDFD